MTTPNLPTNNENIFLKILSESSITHDPKLNRWILNDSAFQSKRSIISKLTSCNSSEKKQFEQTLERFLGSDAGLVSCLLPFMNQDKNASSNPSGHGSLLSSVMAQESLIKLLLDIPSLQTFILTTLLEKLPEYENVELNADLEDNIPKLILSQLRWMPNIEDSVQLAESMLTALRVCSNVALKREIITWIPEVVDDIAIEIIVPELIKLLQMEPELLSSTLDTLSNLHLPPDHLHSVHDAATDLLNAVDPENVPTLVKFLLYIVTPELIPKFIREIRQKLKVETLKSTKRHSSHNKMEESDCQTMLIECIKAGIRVRLDIVKFYLQDFATFVAPNQPGQQITNQPNFNNSSSTSQIQKRKDSQLGITTLDLWIMYVIHSTLPPQRPKVEQLLRKKILNGGLTAKFLYKTVHGFEYPMRDLVPSLLTISQVTLQYCHSDSTGLLKSAAAALYSACFHTFNDDHIRKEILSLLVAHIGSLAPDEAGGALLTIEQLIRSVPRLVEPFSNYIQSIVDHLDGSNLINEHIFKVYMIFSNLAYLNGPLYVTDSGDSKTAQYLHMLIQKQLFNAATKYKKIGAIGCAALICVLGRLVSEDEAAKYLKNTGKDQIDLNIADAKVGELLRLGMNLSPPEALELFLDQLSTALVKTPCGLRPSVIDLINYLVIDAISLLARRRNDVIGEEIGKKITIDSMETTPSIWADPLTHLSEKDGRKFADQFDQGICIDLRAIDASFLSGNILVLSSRLKISLVSSQILHTFSSVSLLPNLCLAMFTRPQAETTSQLHAIFNAESQKTLDSQASQLIHGICILREIFNFVARQGVDLPELNLTVEKCVLARLQDLVLLEAYLDAIMEHIPLFPTQLSPEVPLIYAASINRESQTGKSLAKPKKTKAPKLKPQCTLGSDNEMNGLDDEQTKDSEDEEMQSKQSKTAGQTKAWGSQTAFDVSKYRKNVLFLPSVASRLRPLSPQSLYALSLGEDPMMDNQGRWMLLYDLDEKTTHCVTQKKRSINPNLTKQDPVWMAPYSSTKACLQDMMPAYKSLSLHLKVLYRQLKASTDDSLNLSLFRIGSLNAQPVCKQLTYPCIKLIFQILKKVFACETFHEPLPLPDGTQTFGMKEIVISIVSSLDRLPADESESPSQSDKNHSDQITWDSWTQLLQLCCSRLLAFIEVCNDFETAVSLVELLRELSNNMIEDYEDRAKSLNEASHIAGNLLNRNWPDNSNQQGTPQNSIFRNSYKGKVPLDALSSLLSIHISEEEEPLRNIQSICRKLRELVEIAAEQSKDSARLPEDSDYQTLTMVTLPTYYKSSLEALIKHLAALQPNEHEDAQMIDMVLYTLKTLAYLFKYIASTLEDDKVMLTISLKQGKLMVDTFYQKCDWLVAQITNFPEQVNQSLTLYQVSSRILQLMCTWVKEKQFKTMTGFVAPLKKSLEICLSKVRILADKHGFGHLMDIGAPLQIRERSRAGESRTSGKRAEYKTTPKSRSARATKKDKEAATVEEDPIENDEEPTEEPVEEPTEEPIDESPRLKQKRPLNLSGDVRDCPVAVGTPTGDDSDNLDETTRPPSKKRKLAANQEELEQQSNLDIRLLGTHNLHFTMEVDDSQNEYPLDEEEEEEEMG